jgi:DNA-binding response OmpR family regulator
MQPAPTSLPPAKILVIDDNLIIRHTLQLALQQRGYQVFVAATIADALTIIRSEKPDLLLLDLDFPPDAASFGLGLRDGFWALHWMQHLDDIHGTPVIIISGSDPEKFKAQSLAAGAAAYFHKPVNADELAATVAGLLGKKTAPPPA